jgi:type VI secretion system protein ImpJ
MSDRSRVVWSEGMLLRTQHFQQHDRWVEDRVLGATGGLRNHAWGVRELELDTGLLTQSKVALRRAAGVLPDGTPFAIPDQAPVPDPLAVPAATGPLLVYLALPLALAGASAIAPPGTTAGGARYRTREMEVVDTLAGASGRAAIHVAEPRFQLLPDSAAREAYACLPVALVRGAETNGQVLLDAAFAPPALRIGACPWIASFVDEVQGILAGIATERAAFVGGKRSQAAADLADLLILQLCNKALATARHLAAQPGTHPEDVYLWLLTLLAEATTYRSSGSQVAPEIEPYRHAEPWLAFRPLIAELRRVLLDLARPDRKAVQIPLRAFPNGVLAAEVQERRLFGEAAFYLAASGPVPPDRLRQRLPGQIKIGPAEELSAIVASAVPGIPIQHVPNVPREIPQRRDFVYFELDRQNPYWRKLPTSAGLALHITGDLRDGLEMECWAVRA